MKEVSALDQVIVALDSMTDTEALAFATGAGREFKFFKVGLELYLAYGPQLLKELAQKSGARLFLDLKLHDIPNTVSGAIASLKGLPVEFLTIHISGGAGMIEAALKAQQEYLPQTTLLGVSVLTSLEAQDIESLWGVHEEARFTFKRLFSLARDHGLKGLVCSAHEVPIAREVYGHDPVCLVTPGIRFQDEIDAAQLGDQKRVLAPEQALKLGSNYLVMGRSLTKTKNIESRILELQKLKI